MANTRNSNNSNGKVDKENYLEGVKAVYIEWCDAISDSLGWVGIEDAIDWGNNEDWIIKQFGFILSETKAYILIASKVNPHKKTEDHLKVSGLLKIPKTWVRKRIDLSNSIS